MQSLHATVFYTVSVLQSCKIYLIELIPSNGQEFVCQRETGSKWQLYIMQMLIKFVQNK